LGEDRYVIVPMSARESDVMTEFAAKAPDLPGHIDDSVRALAELHAEHHRQAAPLQRMVDRAVRLVGRGAG
jgi:hypothetical protein